MCFLKIVKMFCEKTFLEIHIHVCNTPGFWFMCSHYFGNHYVSLALYFPFSFIFPSEFLLAFLGGGYQCSLGVGISV